MAASSSGQGEAIAVQVPRPHGCPCSSASCGGERLVGEEEGMIPASKHTDMDVGTVDVAVDVSRRGGLDGNTSDEPVGEISSLMAILDVGTDVIRSKYMVNDYYADRISHNDAISVTIPVPSSTVSGANDGDAMRICQVCCEAVPASSMAGCSGCTHKYCVACIGRYWETQIFSGHHAHHRLTCLHGGCGTSATDADVLNVVSFRVYRRMIYFRARDRYPQANFCPYDTCWERLLPSNTPTEGTGNGNTIRCGRCDGKICGKCFEPDTTAHNHAKCNGKRLVQRTKKQRTHELSFKLWAMTHTKTCPTCNSRIQRAKGCSHMTCIKCSAYFCWRCKGYLNADCIVRGSSNTTSTAGDSVDSADSDSSGSSDGPGAAPSSGEQNGNSRKRACICDKVLTSIAYGGLISIAILGSPLFLSAAVVGGPPWLIYRVVKRSNGNSNKAIGNSNDNSNSHGAIDARNMFIDHHHYGDSRRRGYLEHHNHHNRYQHQHMRTRAQTQEEMRRRELSMRVGSSNNHALMRRRQQQVHLRRRNSD